MKAVGPKAMFYWLWQGLITCFEHGKQTVTVCWQSNTAAGCPPHSEAVAGIDPCQEHAMHI